MAAKRSVGLQREELPSFDLHLELFMRSIIFYVPHHVFFVRFRIVCIYVCGLVVGLRGSIGWPGY